MKTIQSQELLDLKNTPVLINSFTINKRKFFKKKSNIGFLVKIPIGMYVQYNFGTVPYDISDAQFYIFIENGMSFPVFEPTFLTSNKSVISYYNYTNNDMINVDLNDMIGNNVYLGNFGSNVTLGDGSINIDTVYMIFNGNI